VRTLSAESSRPGLGRLEAWVFAPDDARRLAAVRIGLFGLLAFRLAINDADAVAGQPQALFDPVSLFKLLPSMPSPGLASTVQIVGIVAALLAAGGLWPRLSFPTAFAAALFLNLMMNATGKIIHNDLVLTLCLLPLVATPRNASRAWAPRIGNRAREPLRGRRLSGAAYGWPIRTAMIIIALAYLFVGLQKLRYSGLDWITTDNLRFVLYASSDAQASPNQLALFVADHAWLAHLFAAVTMVTEIGFVLCLPFARLRWLFVPGVVGLHLGIGLSMGLDYSAQALAVIIVFVNWVAITGWASERLASRRSRPPVEAAS
jgi:hypothetical protein